MLLSIQFLFFQKKKPEKMERIPLNSIVKSIFIWILIFYGTWLGWYLILSQNFTMYCYDTVKCFIFNSKKILGKLNLWKSAFIIKLHENIVQRLLIFHQWSLGRNEVVKILLKIGARIKRRSWWWLGL